MRCGLSEMVRYKSLSYVCMKEVEEEEEEEEEEEDDDDEEYNI